MSSGEKPSPCASMKSWLSTVTRTTPCCSHRRPEHSTASSRTSSWRGGDARAPAARSRRTSTTSSMIATAGTPPASPKSAARTCRPWSPYGMKKGARARALAKRSTKPMPRGGALAKEPRSMRNEKAPSATAGSASVCAQSSSKAGGGAHSACSISSSSPRAASAPARSAWPRPPRAESTRSVGQPSSAAAASSTSASAVPSVLPPSTTTISSSDGRAARRRQSSSVRRMLSRSL
mmetsp:Transcript_37622/g.86926  ORF Transcript_37622/g.86926 Transcript_37622/m.86926 type:complete len:235 (-) Transcript_37622:166-870(-)